MAARPCADLAMFPPAPQRAAACTYPLGPTSTALAPGRFGLDNLEHLGPACAPARYRLAQSQGGG